MIRKLLSLFFIRLTELPIATVVLVLTTILNWLNVSRYADTFLHTQKTSIFFDVFRLSGFDSLCYSVLTKWHQAFEVYRHPLLADLMWPLSALNGWLHGLTGLNMAPVIIAVLLVLCAVYMFVWLHRLLRRVLGLPLIDCFLLCLLFYSFAYVQLTFIAPDHFAPSIALLVLTLYVAGRKQLLGRPFTVVETIVLFLLTAGVTLSNGVKTLIAALFTNGRRFWRPKYLILAVILPAAAIWGYTYWEFQHFILPRELKKTEVRKAKGEANKRRIMQAFRDTTSLTDSAEIERQAFERYRQAVYREYADNQKKPWNQHKGKPLAKSGFGAWTDVSTGRMESAVENLFGESLQLHRDSLLQDTLRSRPVIISYRWWGSYVVEGLIVVLFLAGIWSGRRKRYLWMCLSCFAFDMLLHMGLGFALNEVYIMTAHWAFVIPITIGFLLRQKRWLWSLRGLILLLALYIMFYNYRLIVGYLTA